MHVANLVNQALPNCLTYLFRAKTKQQQEVRQHWLCQCIAMYKALIMSHVYNIMDFVVILWVPVGKKITFTIPLSLPSLQ